MRKYLVLLSLLTYTFIVSSCYADCCQELQNCGFYTSLSGGSLFDNRDSKFIKANPGFYIGGSVGYKFANSIRIEGEFAYQRFNVRKKEIFYNQNYFGDHFFGGYTVKRSKGHTHIFSYMANVMYDFDFFALPFTPYLGMGIGYADAKEKTKKDVVWGTRRSHYVSTLNQDGLAWQAIAGISYPITQNVAIALEYRYFQENAFKNNKVGLSITRSF